MNRPPIGARIKMSYSQDILTVTGHTERGFTYSGATPISVPRLDMRGDGTGEHFLDVDGVSWTLVDENESNTSWDDFPPGGVHASPEFRKVMNQINQSQPK